jgi:AraC-like DNA-binding protein
VLARENGRLSLIDTRENPNEFPELTESSFARIICVGRRMPGEAKFLREVHVTHPAPTYRAEYDRIFQVPVVFDSGQNALVMSEDESWLNYRIALQPKYLFGVLSERTELLLKELESSKSTRGRVESLLMPVLHTGDVSMDSIAGKMGVSRPTLFRRLKEEGVTFEKVLDELRYKLASSYLEGKRASVNETAYLVGFSEPAAFSRAFKRWTGTSPRAMRKHLSLP